MRMGDKLWEQSVFTVEEAAKICRVSPRTMYDWIKTGFIKCIRHTADVTKREKRLIARSELERTGFLKPLKDGITRSELERLGFLSSQKAEIAKPSAKEILEQRKMVAHLAKIYEVKTVLASELWLPLPHYIPIRDLSIGFDAYFGHTIYWTQDKDDSLIIKLAVEDEPDFTSLKQHTLGSKCWEYLSEWKKVGGHYIGSRSGLLNAIQGDIEKETGMLTVADNETRGVLAGFSWVIFRSLFPQVRQNEETAEKLRKEAVSKAGEGRWFEAVEANKKIIKMFPADIDTLKRFGKAQMELQRYLSAKEAYSRALEIDPYDPIAQKMLKKLLQKCPDDSGIARVDGGRYRVVSEEHGLWLLAVFADDKGENITWVDPTEIDSVIVVFQNLLRRYRVSPEVKSILELKKKIDLLRQFLSKELKAITLETLANTKCDKCPI
jgi:tetratricopeptide (TPR) repeat protein/DNA-binding transcriptional MerR regulator